MLGIRNREGCEPVLTLTRNLQGLATGGKDAQGGTGGEQVVHEGRTGVDEVLAVVKHQERGPGRKKGGQGRR